ncbi:MAG: zf-HC2 domain-containing protein [Candidatus Hydrogenedentes bacterium]|nr:zf-HC2 domain-containing protein [Candidatus Hydrogenedentota bacterium]
MPLECDQIRNEFSALLDNELNPEDRELVEEHLSDCSECLRELHGYKVVSDAYRYHHPVKAPEDFEARFHAAIAPIGRKRNHNWQRWTLAAAAGFTLIAGLAFWQSQFTLKQSAISELALNSPAPESPPPADAPRAMRFQAPAEAVAPDVMMQESAAASVEAAPVPAQESLGASGTGPALNEITSTAAVESEAGLKGEDKAKVAAVPETGGGGFGGGGGGFGGVAMPKAAPAAAPEAATATPVETPVPEMARRTASDAVALKSAPAESDQPALGVANRDKEERVVSQSAMRSEATESAPAVVADSAMPAAAPPASPAPVTLLRWNDLEFTLSGGTWRQAGYAGETLTKVSIPSPEWNGLLDRYTALNTLCDRDEPVIVKLGEVWYSIAKAPTPGNPAR